MTDPPPRPYHHGNLRVALVEAGVELAAESGPAAILLREAARRVGVSHNAGYRHFTSREQLVAAVAAQGMERLATAMTAALQAVPATARPDPGERARARLRAIGRAYVTFALTEPGLFRTAFGAGDPPTDPPDGETADGPYEILRGVVDEFVTAGVMPADRREHSEVVAWAAVHGLAGLVLDGPLQSLPGREIEAALERLFVVVEDGLTTG